MIKKLSRLPKQVHLLVLMVVAMLFISVIPTRAAPEGKSRAAMGDRITISNKQFFAGGQRIWINGANTPWHAWNDFGGSYDAAWWNTHFQELHNNGVNATRVWITCSGEVGINIDANGVVTGATAKHWQDLDSFFQIAQQNQIYIMATFISFDHFKNTYTTYPRWRNWLNSDTNIDSYVTSYVIPFVNRYESNPYLWSIDLINEPDWVVENQEVGQFPWSRLQSYFARASRAIHENSPILVTVGMGMPKYNAAACSGCEGNKIADSVLKTFVNDPEVYIDFYSSHYYPWQDPYFGGIPFYKTPVQYYGEDLGKLTMIGETPANGSTGHTLTQDYENAYLNGWQGVMPWTSNGVDSNGGMAQLSPATTAFRNNHPDLVFPSGPTPTAGPSPTPTNTFTPGPTNTPTNTPPPTNTATNTPLPTITPTPCVTCNLKVQHKQASASTTDGEIKPHLRIHNNGSTSVTLSSLKARYWYTRDTAQPQTINCDYAFVGCGNVTLTLVQLGTPVTGADFYLEVGFTAGAGSVAAGGNSGEIQPRFNKNDWSSYNELDDWSYAANAAFADNSKFTLYQSGVLAWGSEPGGGGPTNTPVPTNTPTNTPPPTSTPTNTLVGTPTPTNTTCVCPTNTPTNTPVATNTPTNTPVATNTPTNTPVATNTPTNTPAVTNTPTNTPVPGGNLCATPTVITGGGSYSVPASGVCFKYVNAAFVRGAMWSVMNGSSSTVSNVVKWYGGRNETVTNCINDTQTLNGNGAQLNNFTVAKDSANAMYVTITTNQANTVSMSIQNWQNGSGCSVQPTPQP